MPTQEEINAANVELQMANDDYAAMADRYNKYQELFKRYALADEATQKKAYQAMQEGLKDFEQLKLNMYAAEDRIQQAQNRVNQYNEIITNQPAQQTTTTTRRVVRQNPNGTITEEVIAEPIQNNAGAVIGTTTDGRTITADPNRIMYTPDGIIVESNGLPDNLNNAIIGYTADGKAIRAQKGINMTSTPEKVVGYTSNGNLIYGPASQGTTVVAQPLVGTGGGTPTIGTGAPTTGKLITSNGTPTIGTGVPTTGKLITSNGTPTIGSGTSTTGKLITSNGTPTIGSGAIINPTPIQTGGNINTGRRTYSPVTNLYNTVKSIPGRVQQARNFITSLPGNINSITGYYGKE